MQNLTKVGQISDPMAGIPIQINSYSYLCIHFPLVIVFGFFTHCLSLFLCLSHVTLLLAIYALCSFLCPFLKVLCGDSQPLALLTTLVGHCGEES